MFTLPWDGCAPARVLRAGRLLGYFLPFLLFLDFFIFFVFLDFFIFFIFFFEEVWAIAADVAGNARAIPATGASMSRAASTAVRRKRMGNSPSGKRVETVLEQLVMRRQPVPNGCIGNILLSFGIPLGSPGPSTALGGRIRQQFGGYVAPNSSEALHKLPAMA